MPFSEWEINQLQSALDVLAQFKGLPQFEWVKELLPKLRQGMSARQDARDIIGFDNNPYLKGLDYLEELYQAICYKKVLCISYQSFDEETPKDYWVHPYYLKSFNNRWFLFGYHPDTEHYNWTLALDRILSIRETGEAYRENDRIDWDEYFEDIVGVTKIAGSSVEEVVLHFLGKTGRYVETKPIHGSQKSKWLDAETLEVQLQLILNNELEGLLLSYAERVKVVRPQHLADTIRDRLLSAAARYGSDE